MDMRLIFRNYLGSIKTEGGTQKAKRELRWIGALDVARCLAQANPRGSYH